MSEETRDAATILLARNRTEAPGIEVYLIDRPDTMKHLPGYSVFPGGKVDSDDFSPLWSQQLDPTSELDVPFSYYVTAIRECFEEVGCLVGYAGLRTTPGYLHGEEWIREKVIRGELRFSEWWRQQAYRLNLKPIRYFGHRMTPQAVSATVRYHTYFFFAQVPQGVQLKPIRGEVAAGRWITPEHALRLWQEGILKMVFPTVDSLRSLLPYRSVEEAWMYSAGVGNPTPYERLTHQGIEREAFQT